MTIPCRPWKNSPPWIRMGWRAAPGWFEAAIPPVGWERDIASAGQRRGCRSMAAIRSPPISRPNRASNSRAQVGLVTLISVK